MHRAGKVTGHSSRNLKIAQRQAKNARFLAKAWHPLHLGGEKNLATIRFDWDFNPGHRAYFCRLRASGIDHHGCGDGSPGGAHPHNPPSLLKKS
jgi:hypothetical protein